MATICYVSTVHPLHFHRLLYKECDCLARAGHDVRLVIQAETECTINGVKIIPLKPSTNRIYRVFRSLLLLGLLLRQKADAYHLCDVALLPTGLILKGLTRARVLYTALEDMSSYMLMKTYLPKPVRHLAKFVVKCLESAAATTFDGLVASDPDIARDLPGMPRQRKMVFLNVPPLSLFPPSPIPWKKRKYDVTMIGTLTVTSGTITLLEALALLRRRHRTLTAIFIGEPSFFDFDAEVARLGLQEVVQAPGRVGHQQVSSLLDDVKIGIVPLPDLPKFRKNISTKMFEYWAKAMPVVSSDLPPERRYLQPGRHGLLVTPGAPRELADAIDQLLCDPEKSERMAQTSRNDLELRHLYAEHEQNNFLVFYNYILQNPRNS